MSLTGCERKADRKQREFIAWDDIKATADDESDASKHFEAVFQEFVVLGAGEVPQAKAERQRKEYVSGLHFKTVEEVIKEAQAGQMI